MATNPFDTFDAEAATAAATGQAVSSGQPATPAPPASANPFDQFSDGSTQAGANAPAPVQIHHYRVKAPNGKTFDFEAPADTPPEQLDELSRKAAGYGDKYPVTAPQGVGAQLLDATKNDVAGIAQGAAALPDMAALGVGKIMSVIPNAISHGLIAAGHPEAAQWVQDNITHPLANPVQIGDAIEHAAPTPSTTAGEVSREVGKFAGAIIGTPTSAIENVVTRLVGDAPKAIATAAPAAAGATADAAPDYVDLARNLNVRRTPATNSRTGVSTVVQAGLGALPGGTPIAKAAEQEAGDLGNAARSVADSVGQVSDRQGAGEAIAQGAQDYRASSKAQATSLYGARDQLIGGPTAPVILNNFDKAITSLSDQFPTSPALQQLREHPVIRQVTDALVQGSSDKEVPLSYATEALSHVRGVLRNLAAKSDATPVVLARVQKVEQGLEDDVMDAARAADIAAGRTPGAEGSAVKAQQDADAFYADRAQALNGALKKPIQSANDDTQVSGESVYNQVANDMNAKSGNLARLRDTWFRLPQEAKSTFAATAIDDLGRSIPGQQNDIGSAWSFQSFLTNLNKISPQARKIVFGGNTDNQLQQISAYANRLRSLDRARNFSNTAQKYFAGAFMATVGGAVMHGDLGTAVEAAAALPATWGGAKLLLSTPAMRDWTAQALKAANSGNIVAMRGLTKKLGTLAATAEPAIASEIAAFRDTILKAANDQLGNRAAASNSNQQPDGNQQ